MGCSFSCKRSSAKSKNIIRIVHLNGYIEYIDKPVLTVSDVVGKQPKHFLFTQPQLISGATTHLKPDHTRLEPGHAYFLLPYSFFGSQFSPVDLAPVARQLAAAAQNSRRSKPETAAQNIWRAKPAAGKNPSILTSCAGAYSSSPARSPYNRHFKDRCDDDESTSKSRSWKPLLATIREKSLNRRSESDLRENINIDR